LNFLFFDFILNTSDNKIINNYIDLKKNSNVNYFNNNDNDMLAQKNLKIINLSKKFFNLKINKTLNVDINNTNFLKKKINFLELESC
jgi:hypothetical protein